MLGLELIPICRRGYWFGKGELIHVIRVDFPALGQGYNNREEYD